MNDKAEERYYVLEYFADRDNNRMVRKLDLLAKALVYRAMHIKYGWPREMSIKVLSFFKYKASMMAVQERLRKNPIYLSVADYFLFKSWDDMQVHDSLSTWENVNGDLIMMYE